MNESETVKKIEIIAFFSLTNGECRFEQNVLLNEQKMKFERKTTRVFAFNTQENPLLNFQFATSKIKIFEKLHPNFDGGQYQRNVQIHRHLSDNQ